MTSILHASASRPTKSAATPQNGRKTVDTAKPVVPPSAADNLGGDLRYAADQVRNVPANLLPAAHTTDDTHLWRGSGTKSHRATASAEPIEPAPGDPLVVSHRRVANHSLDAGGKKLSGDHSGSDAQARPVAAELLFCAEFLDDVEKVRIATQNRMRAMGEAVKCRTSPYRVVYDEARANWAERDVKDGHKHSHALRLVAKAVLRDLFLEARKVSA